MYSYIIGKVIDIKKNKVIIENNEIGYVINMTDNSIMKLQAGGLENKVKIYTYYHVREDEISLFGFYSLEEQGMFEHLISVTKIGAKTAIGILSEIEPHEFALAIITNDNSKLSKITGIGPKTASRIILELQDKLVKENKVKDKNIITNTNNSVSNINVEELNEALIFLGYYKKDIEKIISDVTKEAQNTEEAIKIALKLLTK